MQGSAACTSPATAQQRQQPGRRWAGSGAPGCWREASRASLLDLLPGLLTPEAQSHPITASPPTPAPVGVWPCPQVPRPCTALTHVEPVISGHPFIIHLLPPGQHLLQLLPDLQGGKEKSMGFGYASLSLRQCTDGCRMPCLVTQAWLHVLALLLVSCAVLGKLLNLYETPKHASPKRWSHQLLSKHTDGCWVDYEPALL